MTFRKGGAGKRRDATEPAIIQALKVVGCQVWQVSGRAVPDLLVYRGGKYFPMEVKTAKGKLTKAQRDVPWPIVRSVDDAINVINGWPPQDCEGTDPEPR